MSTEKNTLNSNLPVDDESSMNQDSSNKCKKKDVEQFTQAMLQYYKDNGFRAQKKVNLLEDDKQENDIIIKHKDIEIAALQSKIEEIQEKHNVFIQKMLLITLERISLFDTRYQLGCQNLIVQDHTKLNSIYFKVQKLTEKMKKVINESNDKVSNLKKKNESLEEQLNSIEKKHNKDIEKIKESYETKIKNDKNVYEDIIAEKNSFEKQLKQLNEKNDELLKLLDSSIDKNKKLQSNLEQVTNEKNSVEEQLRKAEEEKEKLQQKNENLMALMKEGGQTFQSENDNQKEENQEKNLIKAEDEQYHKIESKVGEGTTSDVFKIKDTRTGQVYCKKIIKESKVEELYKTFKNSAKEIEISLQIRHPCICECFGYNLEEEIKKDFIKDEDDEDEEESENDDDNNKKKKTTIAIFIEYLPFSAKSLIENKMISNTLKVRIAIEVAFSMKHIHSLGMIHRDLKLENIMMNDLFESKIIDFGLTGNLAETVGSFTKRIGSFSYMSPEMLNEENYDNKTDVYSYGILLFVLFTGHLPKQKIKEKLDKVPLKFPKASSKISEYCIDIIKRCTSFSAEKRPSFDEIIVDMVNNSFKLASEIDIKAIAYRYQELIQFELKKKK